MDCKYTYKSNIYTEAEIKDLILEQDILKNNPVITFTKQIFKTLPYQYKEKLLNEGSKKYGIERGKSTATIKYSQADQNKVDFGLKAVEILQSDKAKQVFDKGRKNNWSLDRILSELQVPKEQKELIKQIENDFVQKQFAIYNEPLQYALELANQMSYTVEINTAKEKYIDYIKEVEEFTGYETEYEIEKETATQHYSNLTVPGGTNYTENEIATPAITPSIKGHAQFATDKGIGWFRSDDKENKVVGWKEEDDFLNSETAQYNPITKDDKVIFGHPTIGKSYLKQKGNNDFITLDDDYANEVNSFIDKNRGSETRQEYKGRKPKEYNEFMLNLFDRLKIQAQKEGKRLFVSNTNILKERMSEFDKVITIPKDEFKKRFDARGATYGFEDWKSDIDATVAKVDKSKVISTTGYLSDLLDGNPKTRRILELQSDLFQKGRDSTILTGKRTDNTLLATTAEEVEKYTKLGYSNLGENDFGETVFATYENTEKDKNQFLQLLNKDNNWVTFFVKSIIQDSAKKGYEKVLFPTSEVVSKIQKFDEAAEKYSNAISKLEKDRTGEDNFIISEWEKDSTKKTIKGTLDFYNNLRNTLDDLVGGNKNDRKKGIYKLPQITDEYGNTWNEITITPKMAETIRLNTPNGKVKYTGDLAIEEKIAEEAYNSKDEKIPATLIGKFIQSIRNLFRNLFKERDNISRLIRNLNQGRFNLQNNQNGQGVRYSINQTIKPGVEELFESNPDFSSQIYEALGFETGNSLENKLKAFFNQFGFRYKEGESSTDLLNKIIYTSKKDNSVFIDNSVKALSQLLLANTNIDFHKLENLIEDTHEFKKLLSNSSDYLKTTHKFLKDGNRIPMEEWVSYIKDYNKIKNEVLEKYIKESLLENKNSTGLHRLINDFLKWFRDLFTNAKNLKEVTDSLIQQVLMNQKEVIVNSKDLQNKERVTLAKALEETTHGKDIIKTFGDFGLILTGSVSAAEQGSVFRKTGKLLHDIDWVVPKGFTKDFNKKLKDTFPGATLVREFDSSTYYTQTYIVPPKGHTISNLTFFKPEVYGERKYIASYDVLDEKGNIVSNYRRYYDVKPSGKVVENREVYNEGLENVDKNLEAVSVDFFQNKEDLKYEPYTVNIEGINLQLSNWLSSFTEKLKYGRAKDLLDYANFIPNDVVPSTPQITPQQKQQAQLVYSQYLNTTNNPTIQGFKNFVQGKQFQKLTAEEKAKTIEQVTKEHRSITALKDLSAKLAHRIGGKVKFENNPNADWKGYNQGMTSVLNEAYMTPDTPFHEILAHPIIRAIKNGNKFQIEENLTEKDADKIIEKNQIIEKNGIRYLAAYDAPDGTIIYRYDKTIQTKPNIQLYQNLLKELETGRGKEVLDRVKRDYKYKDGVDFDTTEIKDGEPTSTKEYSEILKYAKEQGFYNEDPFSIGDFTQEKTFTINGKTYKTTIYKDGSSSISFLPKYTLEEQQEEAIVTLLGMMAADKLDKIKDATLISKLKELWKQISDFVRSLLKQDGIKIDELPITTTLNDLAEIMAYGNNKIILPGYKIEYSTPLGNKYDTLEEVNQEIRGLANTNVEVDLSGVKINLRKQVKNSNEIPVNKFVDEFDNTTYNKKDDKWYVEDTNRVMLDDDILTLWNSNLSHNYINKAGVEGFLEKNKEYEQSKEIIEQWKKENNIQYDPEEVYSRGQGFYSSIGAYSNLELDLLLKNLIQHIQDNKKAGGEFTISAFTKSINKRLKHIEGTGDRVRFVIYPKSKHIKWAAPTDVFSGSVWDAHEKVSKDKKSELLGVSFTKAPALRNINEVSPNLADIIDNLSHVHNEAGLELTLSNFEIEFDENIDYSTKQLINSINKILQQKRLQEIDNFINTLEKQC